MTGEPPDEERDRGGKRESRWTVLDDALPVDASLPETDVVGEVGHRLTRTLEGLRPEPDGIEEVLDGATLPEVGTLEVAARRVPEASIDAVDPDAIVDAESEVAEVVVETHDEVGTVLLEAGEEVLEVNVEAGAAGAEVAGEVAAEALVAALEEL